MARREKNRAGFSHVRVCGLGLTNFPPVIYAYIQSRRRSGQAWWLESAMDIYITYGRYKLGSNRHRRRDMAMMQSALIACVSYII